MGGRAPDLAAVLLDVRRSHGVGSSAVEVVLSSSGCVTGAAGEVGERMSEPDEEVCAASASARGVGTPSSASSSV